LERATGIEPVLPTWESRSAALYFQHLQNHSGKISVHSLHTVHALPDLRVAGGRLGDGFFGGTTFVCIKLPYAALSPPIVGLFDILEVNYKDAVFFRLRSDYHWFLNKVEVRSLPLPNDF
jgi:hypothetical protein